MKVTGITPVGRIVQGDVFEPNDKDHKGNQATYRTGDKAGQVKWTYFIALAIPKTDLDNFFWDLSGQAGQPTQQGELWATLQQVATQWFMGGQSTQPGFSWKIEDGDDPKHAQKTGFAGCYVIKFSTTYAPRVVDNNASVSLSKDDGRPKRGHKARVMFEVQSNGDLQDNPGIFIRHKIVQFADYDEEIVGGISAETAFSAMGALPTPSAAPAPAMGTPAMPTQQPPVPATPTVPPQAASTPAPSIPATPSVPQAPPVPPTPVLPPAPQMTDKANSEGLTYGALKGAGWTDDDMITHGYLVGNDQNAVF